LFQIKFVSKQFAKASKKSLKDEKTERKKAQKAIEQNNIEGARIYAQNAIRNKTESINYLKLSSRLDAVASQLVCILFTIEYCYKNEHNIKIH
jgi:charged multivesicular body protein 1